MESIPTWALLLVAGVTGLAWMQTKFVTANSCALRHEKEEQELAHRRARSHELGNTVQSLVLRQTRTEQEVAKLATHIRWQTAALASVMHKLGANGVPAPPEE